MNPGGKNATSVLERGRQHHRPGPISKQRCRRAIARPHDPRHRICAHYENRLVRSRGDELVADGQRVEKPS